MHFFPSWYRIIYKFAIYLLPIFVHIALNWQLRVIVYWNHCSQRSAAADFSGKWCARIVTKRSIGIEQILKRQLASSLHIARLATQDD